MTQALVLLPPSYPSWDYRDVSLSPSICVMLGKQTQALSMPDKHSTNLDVVPALGDIKM